MKKILKKACGKYLALVLVLLLVCAVCLLFSSRKSGMFIDEIYTYALSNSDHAPFLIDLKNGEMVGTVFTREEFFDYVAVTDGEGFDFGSVYYNQVNDVHPPLYYWLFNIVSTFNRNTFSMAAPLLMDGIIYLAAIIMLYKLSLLLFSRRQIACAVAVLYGLSLMGLSTMLMIRMYVLLMLETVTLAYFVALQMRSPSLKNSAAVGVCIFLGLMTQYYFVFYAFFLCASYIIYTLVKRDFKSALRFALCAFAGVGLLLAVFPAALSHLFADKLVSGANALENLGKLSQYAFRFGRFFGEARHGLKAAIYTAIVSVVILIVLFRKLKLRYKMHELSFDSLYIIVPAFVTLVVVAIVSPVDEARYIYNIAPIFVLAVGFLLYLIDSAVWVYGTDRLRYIALAVIALFSLWQARCAPPEYLYPEYRYYDALVSQHSDAPCVYYNDNRFEAMTQDLLQLLIFDDVYVTDKEHAADILDYVGESPEFVAYFDISEFWGSGYKPEEIIDIVLSGTDYNNAELLYQNGLSATYLISK